MSACSRPSCFAPDCSCDLGFVNHTKCPSWGAGGEEVSASSVVDANSLLLPWSGSALGLSDLSFVAGPGKPMVVGVVGPQNAGKTTLLAAWYLLIGRGLACSEKRRFAGSFSLAGWEALAGSLRWSPGNPPNFPPHTSSRGGRAPGLLHTSFRGGSGDVRSYLFTDAPGEWFQKWSMNRDAPDAQGARWVAEHADMFLLIADRQALAGENKGSARSALQVLSRRLAAERADRPVAIVWTKADVSIAPEIETAVRDAVLKLMPDTREFLVSISGSGDDHNKGQGLLELLDWALDIRRTRLSLPPPQAASSDLLFMFGVK
ncbi:hypothetical protein BTN82_12730 [Pseudomonas chlororaphis]|uniref:Double-GTPase 2 domain-containing protein n=2 Tax=Pseudomonas chlororaphis TaxID=587753 RepID=A0A1Q8EQ54_9PSED|nr:hypothetical protein BTN82_12730 [Pseudomonas chlororaphis]